MILPACEVKQTTGPKLPMYSSRLVSTSTVEALINALLKNNYDRQRCLVWSREKNFQTLGGAFELERNLHAFLADLLDASVLQWAKLQQAEVTV